MEFGAIPVSHADGAILAHSRTAAGITYKKGRRLSAADVAALQAAGVTSVIAARLGPDDLAEDSAAECMARAVTGTGIRAGPAATGRVNLFATADGVAVYDRDTLTALNSVDERITVAAVPPYARVETGQIVATIKIIPIGVPADVVARAAAQAGDAAPALFWVAAFRTRSAGLVQTVLPGTAEKVLAKGRRSTNARLGDVGSALVREERVEHREAEVASGIRRLVAAGCDLVLVLGASATTDRRDTIPAGIVAAGGVVEQYGMPVDPGNLIVLAYLDDVPVLVLPGSARSPREGGYDWLLWRLCAGLTVRAHDIMALGAGGLLKDVQARPLPRAEAAPPQGEPGGTAPRIAALVLAAGQSRRMGSRNKLLVDVEGTPLVRRVVNVVLASRANPVTVVTGHDRHAVEAALDGTPVATVHNPAYADGMATSLRTGVKALPPDIDGVVIVLADMPDLSAPVVNRLIDAFDPAGGAAICAPTYRGKRGNPVLFARRFLPEMLEIERDIGAKPLLSAHSDVVAEIELDDASVLTDVDTPRDLPDA